MIKLRTGKNAPNWRSGPKKYKCIDCNKIIHSRYAKRCRKCAAVHNSKIFNGKNHHSWKGGPSQCINCGRELSHRHDKRCRKCYVKYIRISKNNSMYGRIGNKHPMFGKHQTEEWKKKRIESLLKGYVNGTIKISEVYKDTRPEILLHKALIKKGLKVIKQFYVKGVGFIDRYLPELSLLIEVDGDYWHANPKFYKANDVMNKGLKAKEIWKFDKIKKEKCKVLGYRMLRFWEYDIKNNLNKCLNKI
jgi:very-short-patch-repair endonuclease